jgi:hypothetical protein
LPDFWREARYASILESASVDVVLPACIAARELVDSSRFSMWEYSIREDVFAWGDILQPARPRPMTDKSDEVRRVRLDIAV